MIIAILQIILTIIVIAIVINLLYRKCKMQSQILTIVHLEVSEIGLYERGSLGFLPFLWIGIIIECFQSFGISCKKHILLISVKSVVLTTTVVSLKYINNKLKIMIIAILQIILTIIIIVIIIFLTLYHT
jgi:hypothetical protein